MGTQGPVSKATRQGPVSKAATQGPVSKVPVQGSAPKELSKEFVSKMAEQRPLSKEVKKAPVSKEARQVSASKESQQTSVSKETQQTTLFKDSKQGSVSEEPWLGFMREGSQNDQPWLGFMKEKSQQKNWWEGLTGQRSQQGLASERSLQGIPREGLLQQQPASTFNIMKENINQQSKQGLSEGLMSGPAFTLSSEGSMKWNQASATTELSKIWDRTSPVTVKGGTLRTWSFTDTSVENVLVALKTDGRSMDSEIELWDGPTKLRNKIKIFTDNGSAHTFTAVIANRKKSANTIAIRNRGELEFPMDATLASIKTEDDGPSNMIKKFFMPDGEKIQGGGAVCMYRFDSTIKSVTVSLKTNGSPLNARIELLQESGFKKQEINVYSEDGLNYPFFAIIDTPGGDSTIRVVNQDPEKVPLTSSVEPYRIGNPKSKWDEFVILGA